MSVLLVPIVSTLRDKWQTDDVHLSHWENKKNFYIDDARENVIQIVLCITINW